MKKGKARRILEDEVHSLPAREHARRLLLIAAASVIMAVNIKSFVEAGGLFPGGFNG